MFALPHSEIIEISEVRRSVASFRESFNSCWDGRLVNDFDKYRVESSA